MCALLDTGCDHSIVGRRLIPDAILEPTNQKMYTADGTELPLIGEITLDFSCRGIMDFCTSFGNRSFGFVDFGN